MTDRVWVVEMYNRDRWEPTIGARLTKHEAMAERRQWVKRNPDNRFRVRPYRAVRRD